MIRVDVETIMMAQGPIPSLVVLRERSSQIDSNMPRRTLSVQTGSVEAAAISAGIDHGRGPRPLTHDLMLDAVAALGAKVERVVIDRVDAPMFYASVVLKRDGELESEMPIDARPSDAISLAVRSNAPIFVEDDVMNRAGTFTKPSEEESEAQELEKFDQFVQTLSPDDF